MLVALDTEYSDLRYAYQEFILGYAVADSRSIGTGVSISDEWEFRTQEEAARFMNTLTEEDLLVMHNAKADLKACRVDITQLAVPIFDTLTASWLVNENGSHGLKDLAKRLLRKELEDPIKSRKSVAYWKTYDTLLKDAPHHELLRYCMEDTKATLALGKIYLTALENLGLLDYYWEYEEPYLRCITAMETQAITIDAEERADLEHRVKHSIDSLTHDLFRQLGYQANINSPTQIGKILFSKVWEDKGRALVGTYKNGKPKYGKVVIPRQGLGLKAIRKSPGGKPSTDVNTLVTIQHPFVETLLEYREVEKIRSTYIDGMAEFIHNDKLYPNFNRTGTTTGRLSSSSPNVQNISIRTELGKAVRNLFVAAPGNILVVGDLNQIEYRVLAHFCQEPLLVEGFKNGTDIHMATVEMLLGKQEDESKRFLGKTLNYACLTRSSRILTDDLQWKRAEDLQVGDSLLAFNENRREFGHSREKARRWEYGKVLSTSLVRKPGLLICFDNGDRLHVSDDHRLLVQDSQEKIQWKSVGDLKPGHIVPKYLETWAHSTTNDAGWLAGFFDGEGNVDWGTTSVSQKPGEILEKAHSLIKEAGFTVTEYDGGNSPARSLQIIGGLDERLRFLGSIRPTRLIQNLTKKALPTLQAKEMRRVTRVVPTQDEWFVVLETSTKTYIGEGYAHHNCVFGAGPKRISQTLQKVGLAYTVSECKAFLEKYYASLTYYADWRESLLRMAKRTGFTTTLASRLRRLPALSDPDWKARSYAERQCVNSAIQGSASDILMAATVASYQAGLIPTLSVHDELLFEVPEDKAEEAAERVKHIMSQPYFGMTVAVEADIKVVPKWGMAK